MHKKPATRSRYGCLLAFAIAATAVSFAGAATPAQELRTGGTGNALGTMQLLATAFGKLNPDVKVTVLTSLGSSGAIKAIPKGAIDIGVSARALNEDESKLGMLGVEYARSALVFAVSTKSPVTSLNLDQVAEIYSGKMIAWPDGSQIRPVLRQAGDDNTQQIKHMSAALDKALTGAEQRPGLPFATTDQEAADKTESIPGALGATTLSLINSDNRHLRALTLDGVEPTLGKAASGRYPHFKRYFLITRSDQSGTVKRFIAFTQAPAGREILARAGNWVP